MDRAIKTRCWGRAVVWEKFRKDFGSQSDESEDEEPQFDPVESPLFSSAFGELRHSVLGARVESVHSGLSLHEPDRWCKEHYDLH